MNKYEKNGVLIHDFDGVFNKDSTKAYLHVINRVIELCDIKLDPVAVGNKTLEMWGTPPRRILHYLIDTDKNKPTSSLITDEADKIYSELMITDFTEIIKPIEGAAEKLEELSERYELALNTAAEKDILFGAIMPKLGIDYRLFNPDLVYTADEVSPERAKPEPYANFEILRKSGYPPEIVKMVGDSVPDVLSAQYAGIEPIVPLTGNLSREAAQLLEVDYIIEDYTKIGEVLTRTIGKNTIHLAMNGN